jgi:Family of unknown function (DUF5681)
MTMSQEVSPRPRGRGPGRPFEKGRSGNPGGRRPGSRNKAALAAALLLDGESEALTRKAVEMALAGDPTAMRLCLDRLLPPCRERSIAFRLPRLASLQAGEAPSPGDVSLAMHAVITAAARGKLTPSEAEKFAGAFATFLGAVETAKRGGSGLNLMRFLTAEDDDADDWADETEGGDDEASDDGDR